MGTHRERFLHDFATLVAFLAGEARIDSHDLMSSICSFGFKDGEKRAPTGITDGFGQRLIFEHATDVQVLNDDMVIMISVLLGRLEVKITALTRDLEMGLCHVLGRFPASVAALFAPAQGPLLASEGLLRAAIIARVRNRLALRVSQEHFQANIKTDIRVRTLTGEVFLWRWCFAHDEGVPMPISTQHQMHRLGGAL